MGLLPQRSKGGAKHRILNCFCILAMLARRRCSWCHQELSHSAYYRHSNDHQGLICPGRIGCVIDPQPASDSESSTISLELGSSRSEHSDSSFPFTDSEFDENSGSNLAYMQECNDEDSDAMDVDAMLEETMHCQSEIPFDDQEEIWDTSSLDDSDSENVSSLDEQTSTHQVVFGLCTFLNFFQLFYRVSERAILALITLLHTLFSFLGNISPINHPLRDLASLLPKSLYGIRKKLKEKKDGLVEYAVCPTCSALYLLKNCIVQENGHDESRLCNFIRYPNHPHHSRRKKCNTILLKRVKVGNKSKLVPRKLFVYHSIIHGLKKILYREGLVGKCEHWRFRSSSIPSGTYSDIYEGNVWKEHQFIEGQPFLSNPGNLSLMLNIDWFNPYDHTPYSAGVVYFVVQNLPRNERFKLENVIIAGLIPGPVEPKRDVNSYLAPIVDDLKQLFKGISFANSNTYSGISCIRAILSCVSCDLPATRKVCGFYNFNALKGCSKCLKEFKTNGFGSKPDYSGFNVDEWEERNYEEQLRIVNSAKAASTASAQLVLEQTYGARYSELLRLSYFNVVRHHVIDPMHNLFLGIAKHTVGVWKELKIITDKDFETIQERVDQMNPPPKVGRIPRKIQSGFFSITADEWKNWIVLYSPYALFGLLEREHYECWCYFVEACQLICQPTIKEDMILKAHELLLLFCTTFERLYGKEKCTPNMHMACHLKDTIYDYGSVYGFWCFSFERYNGILEGMKKSWVSPEKQLLMKFLYLQLLYFQNPSKPSNDFISLIHTGMENLRGSENISGSLSQMAFEELEVIEQAKSLSGSVSNIDAREKAFHKVIQPLYEKCFSDIEIEFMSQVYNALFPNNHVTHISRFYKQFKTLVMNGEEFVSTSSRSERSTAIIAHWPSPIGKIDTMGMGDPKIGIIQYFIRHVVKIDSENLTCLFAYVKWYEDHPRRNHFHKSMVICGRLFSAERCATFIPVSRILGRCTYTQTKFLFDYGKDYITLAIPYNIRFML